MMISSKMCVIVISCSLLLLLLSFGWYECRAIFVGGSWATSVMLVAQTCFVVLDSHFW